MSEQRGTSARPTPPVGRLVLGALLILLGIGWLVESLDLVSVPWQAFAPAALVVIGITLLATAWSGPSGGLVAVGVVLSVVVLVSSLFSVPLGGRLHAVGEHRHRPTSAGVAEDGYALAVGELTVDLRDLSLDVRRISVEAGVGIGQLVVLVPADATIEVRARAGIGNVVVGDRSSGGLGVELREVLGGDADATSLSLEVSVGIGKVEVRP
jgi:hypothetical protein